MTSTTTSSSIEISARSSPKIRRSGGNPSPKPQFISSPHLSNTASNDLHFGPLSSSQPRPSGIFNGPSKTSLPLSDSDAALSPSDEAEIELALERTVKSGWLEKKGSRRKNWKPRWFVLRTTKLAYYKNEKEYALLKVIPLVNVHSISRITYKNHQPNVLVIVTQPRIYYIRTPTTTAASEWLEALHAVWQHAKEQQTNLTTTSNTSDRGSGALLEAVWEGDGEDGEIFASPESTGPNTSPTAKSDKLDLPPHLLYGESPGYTQAPAVLSSNSDESAEDDVEVDECLVRFKLPQKPHPIPQARAKSLPAGSRWPPIPPPSRQLRSRSQDGSERDSSEEDNPNVIRSGYIIKCRRGRVKVWRRRWAVLRLHSLTLYKNEKEYVALRVIPIEKIIDVLDADPPKSVKMPTKYTENQMNATHHHHHGIHLHGRQSSGLVHKEGIGVIAGVHEEPVPSPGPLQRSMSHSAPAAPQSPIAHMAEGLGISQRQQASPEASQSRLTQTVNNPPHASTAATPEANLFQIIVQRRKYLFLCPSEKEKKLWVRDLRRLCKALKS